MCVSCSHESQEVVVKRNNTIEKKKAEDPDYYAKIVVKRQATNIARGHDPAYNNHDKYVETMNEKHGCDNYFMTTECKAKSKKTRLEKYGDENFVNPEKAKKTFLENYGYEHHLQCPAPA